LAATLPATWGWFGASAAAPIASASTTFIVACAGVNGGGAAVAVATIRLARPLAAVVPRAAAMGLPCRYDSSGLSLPPLGRPRSCRVFLASDLGVWAENARSWPSFFSTLRQDHNSSETARRIVNRTPHAAFRRLAIREIGGQKLGFFSARQRRRSVLLLARSAPSHRKRRVDASIFEATAEPY
jgi:hypothetical protein